MCWTEIYRGASWGLKSEDAVQYFYKDQPTINSILNVRYNAFKAFEMINSLNLTVHKPLDGFEVAGNVSYQAVLDSKVHFNSFNLFTSIDIIPITAKEGAFGDHLRALPSAIPAAHAVDFIAKTSCNVFDFYFGDVGHIDGIGIMNFPYLNAMVAKTKECNTTLPATYIKYTTNEVYMACSAKEGISGRSFSFSDCFNTTRAQHCYDFDGSHHCMPEYHADKLMTMLGETYN